VNIISVLSFLVREAKLAVSQKGKILKDVLGDLGSWNFWLKLIRGFLIRSYIWIDRYLIFAAAVCSNRAKSLSCSIFILFKYYLALPVSSNFGKSNCYLLILIFGKGLLFATFFWSHDWRFLSCFEWFHATNYPLYELVYFGKWDHPLKFNADWLDL
jgi:hypothetical protein